MSMLMSSNTPPSLPLKEGCEQKLLLPMGIMPAAARIWPWSAKDGEDASNLVEFEELVSMIWLSG